MTIATLPLSYCTNVHPGRSVAEVEAGLDTYTVAVAQKFGSPLAAGLWLARPVVGEILENRDGIARLRDGLAARQLVCYTLNAFPYGDFHSERVKEQVYIPDWTHPNRLEYTHDCARILAGIMPDGAQGSISTVPLGFKHLAQGEAFSDRCIEQLIELARRLEALYDETSRLVRLAIEPEPFCVLETTSEAISFFERLFATADQLGAGEAVRRCIGLCYDICHQAVEFEDVGESIRSIDAAGIRINKVHITCALELQRPATNVEGREALARFVEPRYLHQTIARDTAGETLREVDLNEPLALDPPADFLNAPVWRIHFHVPVDAESIGPLGTTRSELKPALSVIAALSYAPHLEVETYTWNVLPGGEQVSLVDGLTRELVATRELLSAITQNGTR